MKVDFRKNIELHVCNTCYFCINDGDNICMFEGNIVCSQCYDVCERIGYFQTKVRYKRFRKVRLKNTQTVHYCKADKKTGNPVTITDVYRGKAQMVTKVSKWKMDLFDKEGNPVRLEIEFNNSTGKAKASGATTVLKVYK